MGDAERRRHALVRPKCIDQNRHVEALDALEQEGHVAAARALGDAVGDLGDLEIAGNGRGDAAQLPARFEVSDEVAEVGEAHTPLMAARRNATTIGGSKIAPESATWDDGGMRGIIA